MKRNATGFALMLVIGGAACAAAPQPDPVLVYHSCAQLGLAQIDASVDASWRAQVRLPRVLDAQRATQRCAEDAFPAAREALATDAARQRALRLHLAKLKSLIELRMPEHATETRGQYDARIAADDQALARLWAGVAPASATATTATAGPIERAE